MATSMNVMTKMISSLSVAVITLKKFVLDKHGYWYECDCDDDFHSYNGKSSLKKCDLDKHGCPYECDFEDDSIPGQRLLQKNVL